MTEMPFQKPAQLGHLLKKLVRQKGLAEESAQKELEDIWKKVADERIVTWTNVRRLRAGVLEIGVSNGTILEELTCYLQHDLLPAVQQLHPHPEINSLKFVKVN